MFEQNIFNDDLDSVHLESGENNEDAVLALDSVDEALELQACVNESYLDLRVEMVDSLMINESFMDRAKSMIEAIKKFFQKLWAKISGWFNKVFTYLFNWEKRNAKWVKDNTSEINKAAGRSGDFNFKTSAHNETPIKRAIDTEQKVVGMVQAAANHYMSKTPEQIRDDKEMKELVNTVKGKKFETSFSFSSLKEAVSHLSSGNRINDLKKMVNNLGGVLAKARDIAVKELSKQEAYNPKTGEFEKDSPSSSSNQSKGTQYAKPSTGAASHSTPAASHSTPAASHSKQEAVDRAKAIAEKSIQDTRNGLAVVKYCLSEAYAFTKKGVSESKKKDL